MLNDLPKRKRKFVNDGPCDGCEAEIARLTADKDDLTLRLLRMEDRYDGARFQRDRLREELKRCESFIRGAGRKSWAYEIRKLLGEGGDADGR